ncbi:MAG: GNAT family N-acetyltransferase [Acidobacteriota bacterium]
MADKVKTEAIAVTRRPAVCEDEAFLYELYCSTRSHDLGTAELELQQLGPILRMQFLGQRQQYAVDFPDADHQIILLNGEPVGRSIVERTAEQILIVDLAILSQHTGAGIGTMVVKELQHEARDAAKPLRITVEKSHPALGHWERMGFKKIEETQINFFLEWVAP